MHIWLRRFTSSTKGYIGMYNYRVKNYKFGHASQLVACHLHPKEVRGDMQKEKDLCRSPLPQNPKEILQNYCE